MKLSNLDREKIDLADDQIFYSNPRYVHHLSLSFRDRLTNLYSKYLFAHHVILDLMSSWVSHLPRDMKFQSVIGHGLNKDELNSNKLLNRSWTQDLNINQTLPLEDLSIDAVLIVAGWQYLQFPEFIAEEVYRVVKQGGIFMISFSNRAFWSKAPNIWSESNMVQRSEYITSILEQIGWNIKEKVLIEYDTSKFLNLFQKENDPFASVIAVK